MNAELIEKGKFYYNYLIKTTSGMYDLLSDEFKTEIYENKKEMYLVDINVAIQATLLKMSYIDGEFNEKEFSKHYHTIKNIFCIYRNYFIIL